LTECIAMPALAAALPHKFEGAGIFRDVDRGGWK
jgi:hypothetical protein